MDACDHPAMLYVDGVSSIASIDFRMDEWGVDVAVSGSQKGFMLPTGLALVAVSQKALAATRPPSCNAATSTSPRCVPRTRTATSPTRRRRRCCAACALGRPVARGGAGERVRAPPPPRRGGAPGRRRLGPQALRQGAEVALRHGERIFVPPHIDSTKSPTTPTTATACRSASASPRSPAACSASAIWVR